MRMAGFWLPGRIVALALYTPAACDMYGLLPTGTVSRSGFKVRTACVAAKRPVRSLNLDRETVHSHPK
jgi:hypothetical protein